MTTVWVVLCSYTFASACLGIVAVHWWVEERKDDEPDPNALSYYAKIAAFCWAWPAILIMAFWDGPLKTLLRALPDFLRDLRR